jgi:hypothetical protein
MPASARPEIAEESLLPSEIHTHDVGAILDHYGRFVIAGRFMRLWTAFASIDMELQREIDRWVDERRDRGIRHEKMRGNLAE